MFVALSCEVSPRIREFSRNATTIMSTQIGPGLRDYLTALEDTLRENRLAGPLLVIQSNGGAIVESAGDGSRARSARCSPAAYIRLPVALGHHCGHRNVISTDVGGTTFLVGLVVDGEPVRDTTTVINHHPINVPTLRVGAIGSGGGAIAWLDAGGNLRIGPRSAQAVPGPACYGNGGTDPTDADANLVLGILPERGEAVGGRKPLSLELLARQAIDTQIAKPLGLSVQEAAAAIYTVQNAQTGDLLRKTVVEAGHDPREFVLYAFGGAGPAHCARYAAEVGVSEVVVPLGPVASAFSAFGLASSDIALAAELSDPAIVRSTPPAPSRTSPTWRSWSARGWTARACVSRPSGCTAEIDMRYAMQLAEVARPMAGGPLDTAAIEAAAAAFKHRYAALYGADAGFPRGWHPGHYLPGPRDRRPFSPPVLPEIQAASSPDPVAAHPAAAWSASTPRRATSTRRSTTTASCGPGTCSMHRDRRGPDHHRGRPGRHHRHGGHARQPDHLARPVTAGTAAAPVNAVTTVPAGSAS